MPKTRKLVAKRKVESVRERAEKQIAKNANPRRRKISMVAKRPAVGAINLLFKEFHPVRLPDNKLGKILTKRRSLTPAYLGNSIKELRLVNWPSRRQALNLSVAVIVFSTLIAIFVQLLDFGLGKLFREVILK